MFPSNERRNLLWSSFSVIFKLKIGQVQSKFTGKTQRASDIFTYLEENRFLTILYSQKLNNNNAKNPIHQCYLVLVLGDLVRQKMARIKPFERFCTDEKAEKHDFLQFFFGNFLAKAPPKKVQKHSAKNQV